jgi:hypothetical protein
VAHILLDPSRYFLSLDTWSLQNNPSVHCFSVVWASKAAHEKYQLSLPVSIHHWPSLERPLTKYYLPI